MLIILLFSSCAARTNSPTTSSDLPASTQSSIQTSSSTEFHIVGDVNFSVDLPVVIRESQFNATSIIGPSILRLKDGTYRMYLQSRDQSGAVNIVSLSSNGGQEWRADPGIRIQHGNADDVDYEAGEPDAYIGPDGKYYMAYTGRQPIGTMKSLLHKIIFAVSDDSMTWTKLGMVYSDAYNPNNFAASADVIKTADKYIMYYTGGINIVYATSTDGLYWKREKPLLRAGHDSTTVHLNGLYYMFAKVPEGFAYSSGGIPSENDELLMAISTDGINWSKDVYRVVVKDFDGKQIANQDLQDPAAIVMDDGSLKLYLNSSGGQTIFSIKTSVALPIMP